MVLRPEDVREKRFTPVRMRGGYDVGEVDAFLDEVETELTRLIAEKDDLEARLAGSAGAAGGSGHGTEPSKAAARLLEIATRNAEELAEEARATAEELVEKAQAAAAATQEQAREQAERLEADARSRAQLLDTETAERRSEALAALEHDREALRAEVEQLRAFEREYRSRLRQYLAEQLQALDGADGDDAEER